MHIAEVKEQETNPSSRASSDVVGKPIDICWRSLQDHSLDLTDGPRGDRNGGGSQPLVWVTAATEGIVKDFCAL